MIISEAFPSAFMKADDLGGRDVKLIMDKVTLEKFDNGEKPVLHFKNAKRGLVLNITNGNTIKNAYGDDTADWDGKEIELYPTEVDFQGRRVAAIRVRAVKAEENPPAATQPADDLKLDDLIDL